MTDQATITDKPEGKNVKAQEPAQLPVLPVNLVKFAEFVRHVFHVSVPAAHSPKDMLQRDYWKHFAGNLKAGNKIEMLWEDRTLYAEAIVLEADAHGATIRFVQGPVRLDAVEVGEANSDYEVKWAGPHHKFKVIRTSDGEVMESGFGTKDEAMRFIASTLKAH